MTGDSERSDRPAITRRPGFWIVVAIGILLLGAVAPVAKSLLFWSRVQRSLGGSYSEEQILYNEPQRIRRNGLTIQIPPIFLRVDGAAYWIGGAFASVDQACLVDPSEQSLRSLAEFGTLRTLFILGSVTDDSPIWSLLGQNPLEDVYLDNTGIRDPGLEELLSRSLVKSVVLGNESHLTGEGLQFVGQLPHLESVELWEISGVSSDDIGRALPVTSLMQHVHLCGSNIDDRALTNVSQMENLASLFLTDTSVTDAGLSLMETNHSLVDLCVRDTNVSLSSVRQIAMNSPLKRLWLSGTDLIPLDEVELNMLVPDCDILIGSKYGTSPP